MICLVLIWHDSFNINVLSKILQKLKFNFMSLKVSKRLRNYLKNKIKQRIRKYILLMLKKLQSLAIVVNFFVFRNF